MLAQGPAAACGQCEIGLTVAFNSQGGAYGIGYGAHSGESPPPPSQCQDVQAHCRAELPMEAPTASVMARTAVMLGPSLFA